MTDKRIIIDCSTGIVTEEEFEFTAPIETKAEKLAKLATQFAADSLSLQNKISSATVNDGTTQSTKIAAAQSEFATIKSTYSSNRAAIIAG